jgi:general secretion pathway protein D
MLRVLFILALVLGLPLAMPADLHADDTPTPPPISCAKGIIGAINCAPSKRDLKQAKEAFDRGVKLDKRGQLEQALTQFDDAARLVPQSLQFLTAREMVKAKLVFDHIERGNALLQQDARLRAATEFQAAVKLDPDNSFARERLEDALGTTAAKPDSNAKPDNWWAKPSERNWAPEIQLTPTAERATFHFTGDARDLFSQLAAAYKINVQFDESVKPQAVRFNVDDVDFFTALKLACRVSKTMWAALDSRQLLIAADTSENHKQFDRMVLGTFVLPPHATPQEATDLISTLKNVLELKYVQLGQVADTVEVRGPGPAVEACARLLKQLDNPRPQVMIEVRVFQISHELMRNIGVHAPNTFNLYNIPAVALAGLGGQSISQLVNQLISSGGINQAGSSSLSGLLSQLTGGSNSIFSQPLATFGGGLTFMGLSLDQFAAQLSVNESWARTLDDVQMRAGQGTDASFHLGEKYPVMNASYAPIYNSPQISQVLGNQSYVPPIPSVSYEDLGLILKAKPTIHGDGSVTMELEMQIRSLTGDSTNGVPVISNKEYKGAIRLTDGEPAFLAGEISNSDTLSMSGIPGFGMIPGLSEVMVNNTKQLEEDELMISITPHILSPAARPVPEIWLSER